MIEEKECESRSEPNSCKRDENSVKEHYYDKYIKHSFKEVSKKNSFYIKGRR